MHSRPFQTKNGHVLEDGKEGGSKENCVGTLCMKSVLDFSLSLFVFLTSSNFEVPLKAVK